MKRCDSKVHPFVMITLILCLSVCDPHLGAAQLASDPNTIHSIVAGLQPADQGQFYPANGRFWFASGIRRSFGLNELDEPWILAGMKRSKASLALTANTLGWSQMRQWGTLVWTGYDLDIVHFHIGFDHRLLQLRHPYRNDQALLVHAGVLRRISESASFRADGLNIVGGSWRIGGDPLERLLSADVIYTHPESVRMSGGVTFSDQYAPDLHAHLNWMPHQAVSLQLGAGTMPARLEMGIAVNKGGWHSGSSFSKITRSAVGWRQQHWVGRVVS